MGRSHAGFSSAGLDGGRGGGGGAPYRSVFMLARAPLVGEGRMTGCTNIGKTWHIYVEQGYLTTAWLVSCYITGLSLYFIYI